MVGNGGALKYRVILLLLLAVLFSGMLAVNAQAVDQTMTIYFAGTTMNVNLWNENVILHPFSRPETVATLHHLQKEEPEYANNHHKGFVRGAWGAAEWDRCFKDAVALWNQKQKEGAFSRCEGKCVTLNLVGFSRGAVSTMHMAYIIKNNEAYKYICDRIKKINILAFDPVPGDILAPAAIFNLPHNVNYLGFYALDERSGAFAPVFPNPPKEGPNDTTVRFFAVPGSHETMVGNTITNGHRLLWPLWVHDDGNLAAVSQTLKIIATEIMGSSDWGHVRFKPDSNRFRDLDWYDKEEDIKVLQERFEEKLEAMYASPLPSNYYEGMHNHSFDVALEAWDDNDKFCECAGGLCILSTHNPRCAFFRPYLFYPDGYGYDTNIGIGFADWAIINDKNSVPASPLNAKSEAVYLIWDLIAEHGSLDVDADFVDYNEDNCPETPNSDQANNDNDSDGDACDPDDDNDGVLDEEDNCPLVANPDQADWDDDSIGDACDNCLENTNTDQADRDNDGIGDICDPLPSYDPELEEAIEELCSREACANNQAAHDYCSESVNACYAGTLNDQNVEKCWWAGLFICETSEPKLPFVDSDGDGISNEDDNCPRLPNADQADNDGDGRGDVCDVEVPPQGDPAMGDAVEELCSLDMCADNRAARGQCVAFMNNCLKGAGHQGQVEQCWRAGMLQCTGH